MKQKTYLTLGALFFIMLWSFAQVSTVQFAENTGDITNPERGFYKHTTSHEATQNPLTGQEPYIPLTQAQLTTYRNEGNTLILRLFYIREFAGSDHISQDYLNKMTADFQALRANGMKAFIRFAYSNAAGSKDNGITLARIQNHLADVKPILEANKDVITAVQAGLVGAWGEWYYTNNFGDQGQINAQQWIKRYDVITALLQNVPSSIMVQLRSPAYKTRYLQYIGESSNALNESEAYNPALAKARLGHHNDCFLSTPDNLFKTIKIPKSQLINLAGSITVGYRVFPDTVAPLNQRQLPVPSQPMVSYTMGTNAVTGGVVNWDNTSNLVFPFGFMLALKVADDANNVYIYVGESGYANVSTYELYLNTDNNNTTGWIENTGKWTSSGAEILVKDDILNTYTNNTWTPIAAPGMTITPSTTDAIDDVGTFLNIGEIAYQATDSRFVAIGGESCQPNNQNQCTKSLARMELHHYTYMNTDYRGEVIQRWKDDNCYTEMARRLGYRFRLTESRIQSSVNAGKTLSVSIDINNNGFAAPFNKRSLELILTNTVTNQEFKLDLENNSSDIRFWLPGNHTINESVTIPATIPVGSYTLALNLPDASPSLNSDPRYSIQFANQGIWNATKGYNNLNTTINILAQTGAGTTTIVVDGNATDWQNVDNLSLGSGNVQTLKSFDDANNLYFIAQGTLGNGYTVFIDADGKSFTGYSGAAQGADYKIENGNIFRHEFEESWIQITATIQVVHNGTTTEVSIPKTALYGLAETLKFSYNDLQAGVVQNTLPTSGLHTYTLNFTLSVPRPAINITPDGNSTDWLYLDAASSNNGELKIIKVYDDATNLYLLVKGAIGASYQIFLNTDNNNTTGLVDNSIWPDMGADYLVQSGNLFKHNATANAPNGFAFNIVGAITSQIAADNLTHEIAIPKTLFTNPNLPANAPLSIGYRKLINNVQVAKIPAVGGMATYTLGAGAPPTAPNSPSNMSATTVSSSQINLTWTDNASNEGGFDIQRSPTGTNAWQLIATVGANTTSYSNSNIVSGVQYFYRVRATNTIGISNWSNTSSATTPGTAPITPSNLVATALSSNQINLSWTDNANNESNVEIQQSPTGTGNWTALASVNENSTSYSNSGLIPNITHYYRIRATNAIGNSSYTTTVSATTPSGGGGGGAIIVDGNSADWNGISTVTTASGQSMTSMKVTDSGTHLYILIEGAALGPNTQLFINSDNNTATGYQSAIWTNSGMDYLLENGVLLKSTTNTNVWGWQAQTNAVVQYVKNTSVIEIRILKTDINPNSTIKVGVIDYNGATPWALVSKLPATGEMAIYNLTGANASSPPAAPSTLTASAASTSQISLTWTDNAANESNFEIQQSPTGTNNWTTIVTVAANSTSHTITDLTATTTYHYRVRALNANGTSAYANTASATTQTGGGGGGGTITVDGNGADWTGINAVTIASGQTMTTMKVTDSGTHLYILVEGAALGPNTQLFLNTDNNTATGYQSVTWANAGMDYLLENGALLKSTANTNVWSWQAQTNAVVQYNKNANTIEIGLLKTDINPSSTITVGVIDYNGATPWGLVSQLPAVGGMAVYALTGTNGITIPNAPTALAATAVSTSQIDVTWNDNALDETNFEVQQSQTGAGNWSIIATVNQNITSYSNTNLTANTTYYYRVRATNTAGASTFTNTISATTQSASVSITVDGNASDWIGIPIIATETGQTITSMKVTDNSTHLYILLEGSGISQHTEVFINADNDASTGHQHSDWTTSGADYMIEDNEQYTSTSDTSNWDWQFDGDLGIVYAKNASVVEISILKTNISPNATITIGAEDLDGGWNMVSNIPSGNNFITYTLGGNTGGPTIPNAPNALTATTVSTSQIDLTWTDNATDESNFKIQQSLTGTGAWSTIASVNANVTSYSNTGLTANTTYYYRVRATNTAGASAYTSTTSATTDQALPNAPTALAATAVSTSQIDLTWNDNALNESNFEIQQSLTGVGAWTAITSVNANITSYSNTGLTANTTYYYKVRATNAAGASTFTNTISATTQTGSGGPTITIDGNVSDWSTINTIATETGQTITSMKVTDSPTHLYILLEGSGISQHTEVFINADNDASTGHQHSDWTTSGADYMIEDNEQYTSTSDTSNWNWQFDGTDGIAYAKNASVVEISILKTNISPNATITISAEDLDSGWNMVSNIPSGNAFVSYTLTNTAKYGAKPYITGDYILYPNPTQGNFNIKFGNDDVKAVTIYNILGAKIFQREYTNSPKTDQFNLSKLKTGLYKVLITTNHTNIMKTIFVK